MPTSWVVSDTHFFHENILSFEGGRPEFDSVSQMNDCMIENWNSVVKQGDRVYHLGDVAMGPGWKEGIGKLMSSLNGSKRLIIGNHDDLRFWAATSHFRKIVYWRNISELGIVMSHVPLHQQTIDERWGGKAINLHGHIHRHTSPSPKHYCVCVEQVGYTPVNLEELVAELRKSK